MAIRLNRLLCVALLLNVLCVERVCAADAAERATRLKRSPLEVAKSLSKHYGHDLRSVAYIPSLALVGRVWLSDLTDDKTHLNDVVRIVKPYYEGQKEALSKNTRGVNLAGHLVFGELAMVTKPVDARRYVEMVRVAGDRAFDKDGKPLVPGVPGHSEMSDSVFMVCPILARAGRLTGDPKYDKACVRHLLFMRRLCARDDGLYRHSPLDEAAWGRGNGFPALGLALVLTDMNAASPQIKPVYAAFKSHIEALVKHQDADGMWHQVIDRPDSYQEMSSTCMITFAITRGMRLGLLRPQEYEPIVRKAWRAINQRIGDHGSIDGVCVGTGKQKSLEAYLKRPKTHGKDGRGGAMALLAAVEMARWEQRRKNGE